MKAAAVPVGMSWMWTLAFGGPQADFQGSRKGGGLAKNGSI